MDSLWPRTSRCLAVGGLIRWMPPIYPTSCYIFAQKCQKWRTYQNRSWPRQDEYTSVLPCPVLLVFSALSGSSGSQCFFLENGLRLRDYKTVASLDSPSVYIMYPNSCGCRGSIYHQSLVHLAIGKVSEVWFTTWYCPKHNPPAMCQGKLFPWAIVSTPAC